MDQTRDYDRAIAMLEMSVEGEITVSEADFRTFVMDDWNWRSQFKHSNMAYLVGSPALDLMDDEEKEE